jgi:hypothetical protein
MFVKDLIRELQKFPQDLPIFTTPEFSDTSVKILEVRNSQNFYGVEIFVQNHDREIKNLKSMSHEEAEKVTRSLAEKSYPNEAFFLPVDTRIARSILGVIRFGEIIDSVWKEKSK